MMSGGSLVCDGVTVIEDYGPSLDEIKVEQKLDLKIQSVERDQVDFWTFLLVFLLNFGDELAEEVKLFEQGPV